MEKWQEARLKAALTYLERGISVIPIAQGDKIPCIKKEDGGWMAYKTMRATPEQITKWWTEDYPGANVAVVCGEVSNLLVLDFDIYKDKGVYGRFKELPSIAKGNCFVVKTPRGGYHFYYRHREGLSNLRGSEAVDIKTNGGYVLAPPSSVGQEKYVFIHGKTIPEMPDEVFDFVKDLFKSNKYNPSLSKPVSVSEEIEKIKEGSRDESLFSMTWALKKGGMHPADIQYYVGLIAKYGCEPPESMAKVVRKVQSAMSRDEVQSESLSDTVRAWVFVSEGEFNVRQCYDELGLHSQRSRDAARQCLHDMKKRGDIESLTRRGWYRVRDTNLVPIHWKDAKVNALDLKLPFNIHAQWCFIMPKNIIVVSGSPDAGKTAILLNILKNNLKTWKNKIKYFSSEMGEMELKSRITNFDHWQDYKWDYFEAFERSYNFHDVIDPNALNIIDFMEISEDFAKIAGKMRLIHDRLKEGVAIIALQKKKGADMGRGAEFSLEKPRLYLTIDRCEDGNGSTLTIQKAKNWLDPEVNPNGRKIDFWIHGGCNLSVKGVDNGLIMKEGDWYE